VLFAGWQPSEPTLFRVCFAGTSSSLAWNFPLAVAAVGVAFWISTQVEIRKRTDDLGRRERRTYNTKPRQRPVRPAPNEKWRQSVNAPIVEAAWEKLISNIIQEVRAVLGCITNSHSAGT
jgi:hypothetical protein